MEMCMWFFQGFTEIQNHRHNFLWAQKHKNEVRNNVQVILKIKKIEKIKMATTSRLVKYLWPQKL